MNEGINLIDSNKKNTPIFFVHQMLTMRIIVVGLLFIVSVSSVILFILVDLSPLPTLQRQEQSLEQNLSLSKSDIAKLILVKDRTNAISQFLTKRQELDQTIGVIESKFTGNITVTAIQVSNTGTTISVESASLEDLDNFLNGLITLVQQKKAFSQVTLVNLAYNQTNGEYEVSVHANPL